ncbi:hypothetical protein [Arthrobacter sp. H14-L1]|uniref:hypothetical protein n=1 Tax=Arthrobacter sp. H14-L1 TaxID=2996697 RepID=UPI0022720479|nr:hypothetical protein [Arthrobacter sp. H14-L1]MCY0905822.1 hypothetical protein [Arthrobacter sp. H14-L1]
MDTNSRIEQEILGDDDRGIIHARLGSLNGYWRQLRSWRWSRVAAAASPQPPPRLLSSHSTG